MSVKKPDLRSEQKAERRKTAIIYRDLQTPDGARFSELEPRLSKMQQACAWPWHIASLASKQARS
ncbi:hypothetical protein GCM10007207_05120 [Asaia siamensis]|uniref:Transposase n=1 Tax=Asaia siamensis TaxID=110479 RepID=A0ABQ1LFX1_9PROT|nr:hypothetical protein AA0323_2117 [Asaia siamensis NRIC 0323]GGC22858.1 hypothetical protein GCM10007207_05120 [Asaia siamensis]